MWWAVRGLQQALATIADGCVGGHGALYGRFALCMGSQGRQLWMGKPDHTVLRGGHTLGTGLGAVGRLVISVKARRDAPSMVGGSAVLP